MRMTNVKENGFFGKLRELSRHVTSTTNALKSRVQAPPKEDYSSAAVLNLQLVKKEVKELKKETSDLFSNYQRKTTDFENLLKTCQQYLEFQKNASVEIENFLHQYGYTTWAEKEAEEAAKEKAKTEVNPLPDEDTNEVPTACQTPQSKPDRRSNGTPKLEDFGLSDYTMQAVSFGFRREVNPVNTPASVKPDIREMTDMPTHEVSFTPRAVQNLTAITPMCKASQNMCGTPDLKDYGLNEHTLHSLSMFKHEPQLISETPQHVKQGKQNYNFGTPMQSVPDRFVNNGIIVTPGIVDGRPMPTETPSYHIGGVKGFDNRHYKQFKHKDTKDMVQWSRKPALKLEDYLDSSDSLSGPQTFDLPPKRSFVSSRLKDNSENQTPSEPELISARLQMQQEASKNGNLELHTRSNCGKTLASISCNMGDNYTPPEPELLSARLIKHKASAKSRYTDYSLKEQSRATETHTPAVILPKPIDERAYCFSDVPAPPRLIGRYLFAGGNTENIPPL